MVHQRLAKTRGTGVVDQLSGKDERGLVWFTNSGKDEKDSHGSTTLERTRETVGQETDAGCWSLV